MTAETTNVLTQLGVGGTFALLVIKMVLDWLAKREDRKGNPSNAAGERNTAFWKDEIRDIMRDELSRNGGASRFAGIMELLKEIRDGQKEMAKDIALLIRGR